MLANDDTPPSQAPFLSTPTGVATDGSGFVLTQPGGFEAGDTMAWSGSVP